MHIYTTVAFLFFETAYKGGNAAKFKPNNNNDNLINQNNLVVIFFLIKPLFTEVTDILSTPIESDG